MAHREAKDMGIAEARTEAWMINMESFNEIFYADKIPTAKFLGDPFLLAKQGRLEEFEALIKKMGAKFQVEMKDPVGSTCLLHAARRGRLEVLKFLAEEPHNGDINYDGGCNGVTPILHAMNCVGYTKDGTSGRHPDCLQYLIDKGADITAGDHSGNQGIHYAASKGMLPFLILAIDNGCKLNQGNAKGITPLMMACTHAHFPIMHRLATLGVDFNKQDHDGNTALHFAVRAGHRKVVKYLVDQGVEMDTANNEGKRAEDMCDEHLFPEDDRKVLFSRSSKAEKKRRTRRKARNLL